MNITKPTASRTLDGLSRLGFVTRWESDQDSRGVEVYPTDKAKKIFDELNRASGEVTKKFKKYLGTQEFDDVVSRMRDISETIG